MFKVAIGFDPRETVAFHVCVNSIMRHSSGPVSIIPINKRNIPQFKRGIEDGSTEFSFSRFLTPYLCGYDGYALFLDSDMFLRADVYEMLEYIKASDDVAVVKHDYTPATKTKFLGNTQYSYPRKNWSSVMLFNCGTANCRSLTPEVVNTASGKYLHRFEWSEDSKIAEMPTEWNHLVGELPPNENAKLVHHTLGCPAFKGYEDQEYANLWFEERGLMNHAD